MLMNQGETRERRAIELGRHPDAGWADISAAAEKQRFAKRHQAFWRRIKWIFGK